MSAFFGRADFFKRIAAFCGIGAIAATVKPAAAEKNVDLTVTDWTGGMRYRVSELDGWPVPPPGYTFRWTGAVSNDWCEPGNWHCNNIVYRIEDHPYPGEDANRLDTVMIEHGEVVMPVNIAVSLDSRVKGSGVWYRHANFGKGFRRGTWVLREDSTDWIEGRWI